MLSFLFFFNDTPTTETSTLPLHDALPISPGGRGRAPPPIEMAVIPVTRAPCRSRRAGHGRPGSARRVAAGWPAGSARRSEEHTSELQSRQYLVCRLLLEKKKNKHIQAALQ